MLGVRVRVRVRVRVNLSEILFISRNYLAKRDNSHPIWIRVKTLS